MFSHIAVLLDRSGSMATCVADTTGGFNTFIATQCKVPGRITVTLAQFDHEFDYVFEGRPVAWVPQLSDLNYIPRGSTALLDSACRLIDETGAYLERMPRPERPDHVFVVIITDGWENASRVHTRYRDLQDRIALQRDRYAWEFLFLGADQDAIAHAARMGIHASAALSVAASPLGISHAYAATARNVADVHCGIQSMVSYSEAERAASVQR